MTDPDIPSQDWHTRGPPPRVTILPDDSASMPLPWDHWLYAKHLPFPEPILTHRLRVEVIVAAQCAIRDSTDGGRIKDFDLDALVQNIVLALCGRYSICKMAP